MFIVILYHCAYFPDPTIDELPPVTVEEYEALRENISMVQLELFMMKGALQLQLADHRDSSLPRQRKSVDNRVHMEILQMIFLNWTKVTSHFFRQCLQSLPFRTIHS